MPPLKIVLDANALLRSISRRSGKKVDIHFHLNLIVADPDDNKFSDCAFAGNVHFLVTDDKHFGILKSISFPSINIITLAQFKQLILTK